MEPAVFEAHHCTSDRGNDFEACNGPRQKEGLSISPSPDLIPGVSFLVEGQNNAAQIPV